MQMGVLRDVKMSEVLRKGHESAMGKASAAIAKAKKQRVIIPTSHSLTHSMKNTTTPPAASRDPSDDHTPWAVELVESGFDAGFYQVVNSKGWVIATRLVYEDARLLAAAPDLFKQLKVAVKFLSSLDSDPAVKDELEADMGPIPLPEMHAAIAEAEGTTSEDKHGKSS